MFLCSLNVHHVNCMKKKVIINCLGTHCNSTKTTSLDSHLYKSHFCGAILLNYKKQIAVNMECFLLCWYFCHNHVAHTRNLRGAMSYEYFDSQLFFICLSRSRRHIVTNMHRLSCKVCVCVILFRC
jgi:hypothetical protein